MYAENFVYAPPVQRAAQMLRAKKSKILYMRGELSLNGSSSPLAGKWSGTGGGILMRNGCHPIGGMLWLKQQEAKARGENIRVTSVVADCGVTTDCLLPEDKRHLLVKPEDVEDYSNVTITFSDGTKRWPSLRTPYWEARKIISMYTAVTVLLYVILLQQICLRAILWMTMAWRISKFRSS